MHNAAEPTTAPKFYRFKDLPFELRCKIVIMALETSAPPRIVAVTRAFNRDYMSHDKNTRLPALLHAFHESRTEIQRCYRSYFPLAPAASLIGPIPLNFPYAAWESSLSRKLNSLKDRAPFTPPSWWTPPRQTYNPARDIFYLQKDPLTTMVNTTAERFAELDVRVLAIPDYMFCCFRKVMGLLLRTRLSLEKLILVVGDPVTGKNLTKLSKTLELVPLENGMEVMQIECQHCGQGAFGTETCETTGKTLKLEKDFNKRHLEPEKNQFVTAEVGERTVRELLAGLPKMEGPVWGEHRKWFKNKKRGNNAGWKVPNVEIMRWKGWGDEDSEKEVKVEVDMATKGRAGSFDLRGSASYYSAEARAAAAVCSLQ